MPALLLAPPAECRFTEFFVNFPALQNPTIQPELSLLGVDATTRDGLSYLSTRVNVYGSDIEHCVWKIMAKWQPRLSTQNDYNRDTAKLNPTCGRFFGFPEDR